MRYDNHKLQAIDDMIRDTKLKYESETMNLEEKRELIRNDLEKRFWDEHKIVYHILKTDTDFGKYFVCRDTALKECERIVLEGHNPTMKEINSSKLKWFNILEIIF